MTGLYLESQTKEVLYKHCESSDCYMPYTSDFNMSSLSPLFILGLHDFQTWPDSSTARKFFSNFPVTRLSSRAVLAKWSPSLLRCLWALHFNRKSNNESDSVMSEHNRSFLFQFFHICLVVSWLQAARFPSCGCPITLYDA